MSLDQLADLGEFLGGFAVLATLAYLAVQVREANRQSAASLQLGITDAFTRVHDAVLENAEHARLVLKLERGEPLDALEDRQALAYVNRIINIWYGVQQAHDLGLVTGPFFQTMCDDAAYNASMPGVRDHMVPVLERYPETREMEIFAAYFPETP